MLTLSTGIIIVIVILAFFCEYMDSTLGMGYGTTLMPILILLDFRPLQVVPVILLSELVTGLLAAFFHHKEGNVNLKPTTADIFKITNMLSPLGYIEKFKKTVPLHLKIALLLSACSIVGTIAAVFTAVNIPNFWLKLYIGVLVLAMGILILVCLKKEFRFSWFKVGILGAIASFNKGMSGGGYGPIVTGGQILSGIEGKNAVGITSLAEGLTCLVGVLAYILISKGSINWKLAIWIIAGAILSVPLSAKSVKRISAQKLKLTIGIITIILGSVTIIKTII